LLPLLLRFDELTDVVDCFVVLTLTDFGADSGLFSDLSETVVVDLREVEEY